MSNGQYTMKLNVSNFTTYTFPLCRPSYVLGYGVMDSPTEPLQPNSPGNAGRMKEFLTGRNEGVYGCIVYKSPIPDMKLVVYVGMPPAQSAANSVLVGLVADSTKITSELVSSISENAQAQDFTGGLMARFNSEGETHTLSVEANIVNAEVTQAVAHINIQIQTAPLFSSTAKH